MCFALICTPMLGPKPTQDRKFQWGKSSVSRAVCMLSVHFVSWFLQALGGQRKSVIQQVHHGLQLCINLVCHQTAEGILLLCSVHQSHVLKAATGSSTTTHWVDCGRKRACTSPGTWNRNCSMAAPPPPAHPDGRGGPESKHGLWRGEGQEGTGSDHLPLPKGF